MVISPLQNLWGFISSRPPVVVFSLCLALFAVTTFSLAYYVRNQDLRNPDIKLDWNIFLEKLSQQKFCLPTNHSSATSTDKHHVERSTEKHNHTTEGHVTISLLVNVTFVTSGDISVLSGFSQLTGEFDNEQFLLPSANSGVITYHLDMPSEGNITSCKSVETCEVHQTLCATFHGSSKVLPPTRAPLPKCPARGPLAADTEAKLLLTECTEGLQLQLKFLNNPDWTTMLTVQDHSIIDLHLMHTTYFLLAMVLMLVLYATIRGRPRVKMTLSDKALLDGQI